jgi:hypothetical protein
MIPIKGKKYMINCQGPYDYNRYMGEGVFTGEVTDMEGETCYGFMIPVEKEICFFTKEEIIAEFSDDNQIRPSICDPENYPEDDESPYCEKCGSCGEDGCCPPINCEAVKCKYGEINLKDYKCFQDQWEVMFNALKNIVSNPDQKSPDSDFYFSDKEYAQNALNEVDKLWDKLYSKE